MKKRNSILKDINGNSLPIITRYDIITGVIVMAIIVTIIISLMTWIEHDRKWIKKDTNVREETIQHYNPYIP